MQDSSLYLQKQLHNETHMKPGSQLDLSPFYS